MRNASKNRQRSKLRQWAPTAVVAVLCGGFVAGAYFMQASWWANLDRPASADQRAPDGMSMFGDAGVQYFTRQGIVRIRVDPESLPASELDLEESESETIYPSVPIEAVILSSGEAFYIDSARSIRLTTLDNRLEAAEIVQESNNNWLEVYPKLVEVGTSWGWQESDFAALQDNLTTASRLSNGDRYAASLPPLRRDGATVNAEIEVDTDDATVIVKFIFESR